MSKAKLPNYIDAPCKGCLRRQLGCHSTCTEYREYREALMAIRQERWEAQGPFTRTIQSRKVMWRRIKDRNRR